MSGTGGRAQIYISSYVTEALQFFLDKYQYDPFLFLSKELTEDLTSNQEKDLAIIFKKNFLMHVVKTCNQYTKYSNKLGRS